LNEWFKKEIQKEFEIKDLGRVKHFLGIEFHHMNDGSIMLTQENQVLRILKKCKMEDCNTVKIPMDPNVKISKKLCPSSDEEKN